MSYYGGYNGSSSAYDLSLFEPRAEYVRQRPRTTTTQKRKSTDRRPSASKSGGRTAAAAAERGSASTSVRIANRSMLTRGIAIAVLGGLIITALVVGRVQYHELIVDIESASVQLEELQQDYEAMRVTFDTKMSDSAVEEYAVNELNMQKRENSQTEYITLGGGEVFEVTGSDSGWLDTGVDKLMAYVN